MKKIVIYILILVITHLQPVFSQEVKSSGIINNEKNNFNLYINKNYSSRKYILGPNDVIGISLFNIPELNIEKVRVQPDGKIVITPLGAVTVAGMTIDELKDTLSVKYAKYIKNPQVSIYLMETRPYIAYVTGAVMNPGSYEINTQPNSYEAMTSSKPDVYIQRKTPLLSNVLVAAGGLSFDADLEHIKITNSLDNSSFEVNLLDLLESSNASQDIYLMPGDIVNVPKLPTAYAVNPDKYRKFASASFSPSNIAVKVYGYVNTPGLIKLDPAHSLNLTSAIMAAGGYRYDTPYIPKKVYISRSDANGKFTTMTCNPQNKDVTILPNDVIYVPDKIRPAAGRAFDYVTRLTTSVSGIAGSYNEWSLMFDPKRYNVNVR